MKVADEISIGQTSLNSPRSFILLVRASITSLIHLITYSFFFLLTDLKQAQHDDYFPKDMNIVENNQMYINGLLHVTLMVDLTTIQENNL